MLANYQFSGPEPIHLQRATGESYGYRLIDNVWVSDGSSVFTVEQVEDGLGERVGWIVRDRGNVTETYNASGRLTRVVDNEGKAIDLSYVDGRLDQVTGPWGRVLSFSYDATTGRLVRVATPAGVIKYEYLVRPQTSVLAAAIYPDQTPSDDTDNPRRLYHYEDARFITNLTGITDERDVRFATWSYDDKGRVTRSVHAGDNDDHLFTYNADGTTTVTDPLERERTYSYVTVNGVIRVGSIVGGECSGCSADTTSYTYDTNGYVETKTDFNGNVTRYVRDDFGRELSRTEAEGTPQARTVATVWDTSINKPLEITEPGRIITFTYDTQGRLASRVVQSQP